MRQRRTEPRTDRHRSTGSRPRPQLSTFPSVFSPSPPPSSSRPSVFFFSLRSFIRPLVGGVRSEEANEGGKGFFLRKNWALEQVTTARKADGLEGQLPVNFELSFSLSLIAVFLPFTVLRAHVVLGHLSRCPPPFPLKEAFISQAPSPRASV
ncbi:hypothetical protein GQ607_010515 [Colletotrichum asianum]|uniref:Uncharacterized protein n=1 Tax=Colletotrichum asianum TaxID=702518 RepID=A0A8H3WAG8_9PEZI|nr:hypothetical protein GQ607_010515 [Colletotrichum asianum]